MTAERPLTSPTTPRPARQAARAVAVGIAATALLAGCSEASGPLDRPEPESPRPDMTFTAEFHQTDSTVGWSWTLRNDDDQPVLVFAGPDPEWMSADEPPPTWVLGAKGNTVELAQRLIAPPDGVAFESPYGVAVQLLEPGDQLTGTAEAPLPLVTTLPWGGEIGSSLAVPRSPSEVYLCIGIGTVEEFGHLLTGDDRPYAVHAEGTAAWQHQFCTDTEPLR